MTIALAIARRPALLWFDDAMWGPEALELTRHLLAWFFATLSKIGVLYGSFATAISLLLSFEIAATVLLVGAQVIALYEQRPRRKAVVVAG